MAAFVRHSFLSEAALSCRSKRRKVVLKEVERAFLTVLSLAWNSFSTIFIHIINALGFNGSSVIGLKVALANCAAGTFLVDIHLRTCAVIFYLRVENRAHKTHVQ